MTGIPPDFRCPYADRAGVKCMACDCFIDTHPDSPFALHPEDFVVVEPGSCACPEGHTCGSPQCRQVVAHPEMYEVRDGGVYVKLTPEIERALRKWLP